MSVACSLCWLSLALPWAMLTWGIEPYMDEIFHVPQTQRYCEGQLTTWDPKITTLPGLYLFAAGALSTTRLSCSPQALRLMNVLFGMGSVALLQRLLSRRMSDEKASAHALVIALYPVHFFYSFLFYTDVGSVFWVLLTHHLATGERKRSLPSRGRLVLAALAGAVAVLFRQTNAVWLLFSFGTAALQELQASPRWGAELCGSELRGRSLLIFCKALLLESPRLFRRLGVLLGPVVAFLGFVLWNGGRIVVGDHSNHVAVLHWAQLGYVSAATAALWGIFGADATVSLSSLKALKNCLCSLRGAVSAGLFMILAVFLLNRFSLAHPFLLADNRHYTFYVWNRFLGRHRFLKEAMAPIYCYSAWLVSHRLAASQSALWVLIWWVAAALTLVPAYLLEPRYWTTAVLLAHAHSQERSWSALIATGCACLAVNAFTLGIFIWRPFTWPNGEIARFMW